MAASTINIAEFRCHTPKRSGMHIANRGTQEETRLRIVRRDPVAVESQEESKSTNPPGVLEISAARERCTDRELHLYRPLPFRRRANLVRFNEPQVAVLRVAPHPQEAARAAADDYDLPPAA